MSDDPLIPDQGGQLEHVAGDFVVIPRAQHEALMKTAQFILTRATHLVPCSCKICELAAALRVAGISTAD